MVVTENGTICRQAVAKISTQRRSSMGVKIIKLDDGDKITAMKSRIEEEVSEKRL